MTILKHITPSFAFTLALASLSLGLAVFSGWSEPQLQFDRHAIADGQWWRLVTGQWIHYGLYHTLNNVLILLVIGAVLWYRQPLRRYLLTWIICFAAVAGGLYYRSLELDYYAGLSGALHGILLSGLLLNLRRMPWIAGAGILVTVFKIWQEQQPGYDTSHIMLSVPVAVDSHLYGALAGLVTVLVVLIARGPALIQRRRQSKSS